MLKSSDRTIEVSVMEMEEWSQVRSFSDGTPCAAKVACTVWTGGKSRDTLIIKGLPIGVGAYQRNKRQKIAPVRLN